MITLKEKLHLKDYSTPHWFVGDKKIYSKYHAIKECQKVGHEWPGFRVWSRSKQFNRPNGSLDDAVKRQCDIISDSYSKVRLFYSGGRDSHMILMNMLKNRSKLDEIAIYRRFPGVIDNETNEFDKFNLLSKLKKTLDQFKSSVPVKFYDLLPEHFNWYSKRLEEFYFPYTNLEFFSNNLHSLAEWFPHLVDPQFVNVFGQTMPHVENNSFYWVDMQFNMSNCDPYNLYFFADERNTDLSVFLAYAVKDYEKKQSKNRNWFSGSNKGFLPVKNFLKFPKTQTPLDDKWAHTDAQMSVFRWILCKKEVFLHANALRSEIGRETYNNMISFYDQCEKNYAKYFEHGSIFYSWIGSVSERHTLLDL